MIPVCQNFHTMNTFLQVSCRVCCGGLFKPTATGLSALGRGLTRALALHLALSLFLAPSVQATNVQAASASTAAVSARQGLFDQAQAWLAKSEGKSASQIQFAPLDSRVLVKTCAAPLMFDLPFASRDTVRARCPTLAPQTQSGPEWQLYLRVLHTVAASADPRSEAKGVVLRKVLRTKQQLQRGTRLAPEMFEVVELEVPHWTPAMLDSVKDIAQMELLHDLPAGSLLQGYDAKKAILVKQGQVALMTLGEGKGFQISVKVEALQDGRMGEQIRLKNAESGKILTGVVSGANTVKGI